TCASAFLLSRRLLSSSSQVRPLQREFSPSDSELYSEYRARIYEELMMALPLDIASVSSVRSDSMRTEDWGETTIVQKHVPKQAPGIVVDLAAGFGLSVFRGAPFTPPDYPEVPGFPSLLDKRFPAAVTIIDHSVMRKASIGG